MTFLEFKTAVLQNMGPDGQRTGPGVSGLDDFRNRSIENAMIDLQRNVPALRLRQRNTYFLANVSKLGSASIITLPAGKIDALWIAANSIVVSNSVLPTDYTPDPDAANATYYWNAAENRYELDGGVRFWVNIQSSRWRLWDQLQEDNRYAQIANGGAHPWSLSWGDNDGAIVPGIPTVTEGACEKYQLDHFPWKDRDVLACDMLDSGDYRYALSPDNRSCMIHPGLTAGTKLMVDWNGMKLTWADADVMDTNWDQAVECVSEYAKFRLVQQYDKDAVARSQRHESNYVRLRTNLFLELRA